MFYSEKLVEAFAYAMKIHKNQTKMGHPILSHVLDVVSLIIHFGGDEDAVIAGMLHDTKERGPASVIEEIRERFGEHIAQIVDLCSEVSAVSWSENRTRRIEMLAQMDKAALLVVSCEVLSNAKRLLFRFHAAKDKRSIFTYLKKKGGIAGKLWYYRSFSDAVKQLPDYPSPVAYELQVVIKELETLIY
jgi:(p)ppGpp synthase/HD superfamily hydrolase